MKKILAKFDKFLDSQKKTEYKAMLFLPILLFGFISYYFIYPITDNSLKNAKNKETNLKQDIANMKGRIFRLKSHTILVRNQIIRLNKDILHLNKTQVQLKKMVKELSFLRFNLNKWANFYNKIPNLAVQNHLVILDLKNNMNNKPVKKDKFVSKKMEIRIKVLGDYRDVIKFLNSFETQKELLKVTEFQSDGNISIIKIEIFGADI